MSKKVKETKKVVNEVKEAQMEVNKAEETIQKKTIEVNVTDVQLQSLQQIQQAKANLQNSFKEQEKRESEILGLIVDFNNIPLIRVKNVHLSEDGKKLVIILK